MATLVGSLTARDARGGATPLARDAGAGATTPPSTRRARRRRWRSRRRCTSWRFRRRRGPRHGQCPPGLARDRPGAFGPALVQRHVELGLMQELREHLDPVAEDE